MIIKQTLYGTSNYARAVALRRLYLRAPLGLEFTSEELELDALGVHFLAFEADVLIGCVIGQQKEAVVKVRQMVVAETHRKSGVGRKLMHALEMHFSALGEMYFTLHAREDAIPFYEALGYVKVELPFTEIGIPHQRLDKFVPSAEAAG